MDSTNWVSSITNIVLAFSVLLIWWQALLLRRQIENAREHLELSQKVLKADHDRSRKERAIEVLRQWNKEISPQASAADKLVRKWNNEQCRRLLNHQTIRIKPEDKNLVEACLDKGVCNPNTSEGSIELEPEEVTQIRYQVISYLNSTEIALISWHLNVADQETIERQFSFLYQPEIEYSALENFRKVVTNPDAFPAIRSFI